MLPGKQSISRVLSQDDSTLWTLNTLKGDLGANHPNLGVADYFIKALVCSIHPLVELSREHKLYASLMSSTTIVLLDASQVPARN